MSARCPFPVPLLTKANASTRNTRIAVKFSASVLNSPKAIAPKAIFDEASVSVDVSLCPAYQLAVSPSKLNTHLDNHCSSSISKLSERIISKRGWNKSCKLGNRSKGNSSEGRISLEGNYLNGKDDTKTVLNAVNGYSSLLQESAGTANLSQNIDIPLEKYSNTNILFDGNPQLASGKLAQAVTDVKTHVSLVSPLISPQSTRRKRSFCESEISPSVREKNNKLISSKRNNSLDIISEVPSPKVNSPEGRLTQDQPRGMSLRPGTTRPTSLLAYFTSPPTPQRVLPTCPACQQPVALKALNLHLDRECSSRSRFPSISE